MADRFVPVDDYFIPITNAEPRFDAPLRGASRLPPTDTDTMIPGAGDCVGVDCPEDT